MKTSRIQRRPVPTFDDLDVTPQPTPQGSMTTFYPTSPVADAAGFQVDHLTRPSSGGMLVKALIVSLLSPDHLKFKSCDHQNHSFYNKSVLSRFRKSPLAFDDVVSLMQGFWCHFCRDGYVQGVLAHDGCKGRVQELAHFISGNDVPLQLLALSYTILLSCFHENLRTAFRELGVGAALERANTEMSGWNGGRQNLILPNLDMARYCIRSESASHQLIKDVEEIAWASRTKATETMMDLFECLSAESTRFPTALSFSLFSGSDLSFWIASLPETHSAPSQRLVSSIWDQLARTPHPIEHTILGIFLPTLYNRFRTPMAATHPIGAWESRAAQDGLWQNLWLPLLSARLKHPELFRDHSRLKVARFVETFDLVFQKVRYPRSLYDCVAPVRWEELRAMDGRTGRMDDSRRLYDVMFGAGVGAGSDGWIASVIADETALARAQSRISSVADSDAWLLGGAGGRQSQETERVSYAPPSLMSSRVYGSNQSF